MNYRMITYILGWILIFEALFMTVPMATGLCYGEAEVVLWYLATAAVCAAAGLLLTKIRKPENMKLYSREGFVIAALSWLTLGILGAFPMFLSGEIPNYIDALFETVSGLTTTGATILGDVEALSHATLMWRSFTHWVGGMGVLVFIMAFVSLSGAQNLHIMKAESPGPSVSKLVPRVKTTAIWLYAIYFVLTVIEFIMLLFDMTVFEALNTAFATAGTGGFGIYNDSIERFSDYTKIVVTVFMLLFSVNFNSYFFLLKGKIRGVFTVEVITFFAIVLVASGIISINTASMYDTAGEAVMNSSFTVASLISTTGFSIGDFNLWPELSRTILVVLMFIGACAGSTGGGIKVSRILIWFKSLGREILLMVHPKQTKKVKVGSHEVNDETVRSTSVYIIAFVMLFVISLLAISFDDHDLTTNFTAVTACVNNVGPGLDGVGPTANYGFFSIFSKIVLIFDMLAGRLELFPMLLLFTPATWKK